MPLVQAQCTHQITLSMAILSIEQSMVFHSVVDIVVNVLHSIRFVSILLTGVWMRIANSHIFDHRCHPSQQIAFMIQKHLLNQQNQKGFYGVAQSTWNANRQTMQLKMMMRQQQTIVNHTIGIFS